MRNNFKPKYLRYANKKLDKHILSLKVDKQSNKSPEKKVFKKSLWKKLVGLFK